MAKPTIAQKLELLEAIALKAQIVADAFQKNISGDAYRWIGSMNYVDDLRQSLEENRWASYDPNEGIPDEGEYDE